MVKRHLDGIEKFNLDKKTCWQKLLQLFIEHRRNYFMLFKDHQVAAILNEKVRLNEFYGNKFIGCSMNMKQIVSLFFTLPAAHFNQRPF